MPARFADRLDVDADRDAVQGSLLATVPGRYLNLVLLLAVVAQLLCVPDVTLCGGDRLVKFNPNRTFQAFSSDKLFCVRGLNS